MNYPTTGGQNSAGVALGAAPPPRDHLLEVVLKRSAQQLEGLQVMVGRVSQLADRMVGPVPEERVGTAATDPGSTLGRIEAVQSMIDVLLKSLHHNLERLERL